MNRRAFVIAFLLAGVGTLLLLLYMRRFELEMSGGEQVELITLVKPVPRGARLTEEMLSSRYVPVAYVEDRSVKASERSKVIGLRTTTPLHSQQSLFWTDLAITTEDRDLSSLVQPGKRAVTVRATGADDTRGNALIRPGDYVDVIVTMEDERPRVEGEVPGALGERKRAVVLAQKLLVLAVGLDTRMSAAPGTAEPGQIRDKLLTLSLNLQQAQLLALAAEKGTISVALRAPDDQAVAENPPDLSSSALLDKRERDQVQHLRTTPVAKQDSGPTRIQEVR